MLLVLWLELEHTVSQPFKKVSGSEGSDMRFADLEGADLSGTDLRGVNLAGANLSNVILEGTNLEGAIYNAKTVWPEGFDPEQVGVKFVAQAGSKKAMESMEKA